MSKKTEVLSTRVSSSLKDAVIEYVKSGYYINESDFVRQAVREKIFRKAPETKRG